MLSIPIHIIGTRRVGLLPQLIPYILAILLFCHFFLALFAKNTLSTSKSALHEHRDRDREAEKVTVSKETPTILFSPNIVQEQRVHRRSVPSNSQNGTTRRSNPTKVRARHQNRVEGLKYESEAFYPWMEDAECQNYSVSFAEFHTFKPRALVSFPGSGNSWLRYLLESATGIFTGSIFNDKSLYRSELRGEMSPPNDGRTIVQKTHHDSTIGLLGGLNPKHGKRKLQAYVKVSELVFGYRGILLIRNPFDALLSYWNFMKTKDHKGHARSADFSTEKWKTFVNIGAQKWASLIRSWVDNSMDLHIVQYEKLQQNPKKELKLLLNYLNFPVDPHRLQCTLKYLEGPFHRDHHESLGNTSSSSSSSTTNAGKLISTFSYLDLIVQQDIDQVNALFLRKEIPVRLNYTLPEAHRALYRNI